MLEQMDPSGAPTLPSPAGAIYQSRRTHGLLLEPVALQPCPLAVQSAYWLEEHAQPTPPFTAPHVWPAEQHMSPAVARHRTACMEAGFVALSCCGQRWQGSPMQASCSACSQARQTWLQPCNVQVHTPPLFGALLCQANAHRSQSSAHIRRSPCCK